MVELCSTKKTLTLLKSELVLELPAIPVKGVLTLSAASCRERQIG
jgi:hypothetical protein